MTASIIRSTRASVSSIIDSYLRRIARPLPAGQQALTEAIRGALQELRIPAASELALEIL